MIGAALEFSSVVQVSHLSDGLGPVLGKRLLPAFPNVLAVNDTLRSSQFFLERSLPLEQGQGAKIVSAKL